MISTMVYANQHTCESTSALVMKWFVEWTNRKERIKRNTVSVKGEMKDGDNIFIFHVLTRGFLFLFARRFGHG